MSETTPLTLVNARIAGGATSLRVIAGRIASLDEAPHAGDRVLDLHGDRLLPGLLNAHDHLQLNSLPPAHGAPRYQHVREWIRDINTRRRLDVQFETAVAAPRAARLFCGGLKNLLSGVTTVAHHDPLYPTLEDPAFPVAVLQSYGWSHSLDIDGDEAVSRAHARTPATWPWIIHAAEGIDASATAEFERLDALGCVGANTVLVHGVGLRRTQRARLLQAGGGLIWCPASNLRLFGTSAAVKDSIDSHRVALGSDSRMSGSRDLLGELQVAAALQELDEATLTRMVTQDAADLLRLSDRGALLRGRRADLLVIPAHARLQALQRKQVRLVLIEGRFHYGEWGYARALLAPGAARPVDIDGCRKALATHIAVRLSCAGLREPGVRLLEQQVA